MLALATLGNTLGAYSPLLRTGCGLLATLLFLLLALKIVFLPHSLNKALSEAPVASVLTTLPMGMMILATYLLPLNLLGARLLWWTGVITYVLIMSIFTLKHVFPIKTDKLLPGYFVTYVGLVVMSVTSKAFGMAPLGMGAFIFGALAYTLLLPLVTYRLVKVGLPLEPTKPMAIIYAAPANLLLVGALKLSLTMPFAVFTLMWVLGVMTTLVAWLMIPRLLMLKFYPSYAAMTFPLVIGAMASQSFKNFVLTRGANPSLLFLSTGLTTLQLTIASAMVVYVTYRYGHFMLTRQTP